MNADGSGATNLTVPGANGDDGYEPSFSPDGTKIAFEHYDGSTGMLQIATIAPDGSGQTILTPGATTDFFSPDFSPDGTKIAFDGYDGTTDQLYLMNADGTGRTPITGGPDANYGPVFAPDGTRIAFERDDQGINFSNIALIDPAGVNQNIAPVTNNAAPVFSFEPTWQPLNPPTAELGGKATSKSVKKVTITVTSSENATVSASGSGKAPKPPKRAATKKAKKFKIPPVTVQVAAGVATPITLKVSKKGQKALKAATKAGKKGKATITATLTDDLAQTVTETTKVTFKAKKK